MLSLRILIDNVLFSLEKLIFFIGNQTHEVVSAILWIIVGVGTVWLIATFLVWSGLMILRGITKRPHLPKPIARFSLALVGVTFTSFAVFAILSGFVGNFLGFGTPFLSLGLDFPAVLVLLLGGPVITTGWLMSLFTPKIITFKVSKKALAIFCSVMSALSLGAMFFTVVVFFLYYQSPCEQTLLFSHAHVHAFNQHIKDLCYFRPDKNECPKSEAELMAFKPEAYQEIQQCGTTHYFFDDQSQNYIWEIDSYVDRYGTRKYPQF